MDALSHTSKAERRFNSGSFESRDTDEDGNRVPLPRPRISQLSSPAYCCDRSGSVISFNLHAVELWGRSPNPAHLFQWSGALRIFDLDGAALERSRFPSAIAVSSGRDVDMRDLWLERSDGSRRRIAAHARCLRDEDGKIVGSFCMVDDVTEQEQLAQEKRGSDDARDAFLSMLAHELRNPLAPILTAACAMRRLTSDGRICGMAGVVERQAKQLARLVADLLDASNLAQDGIAIRPRSVALAEIMESALDELRPKADARAQRVHVEFQERAARLFCDPERIAQAVANVLVNASAFSSEGGPIWVRAVVDGAMFNVDVEDGGIGIEPEDLEKLFTPYSQFATHSGRLRSGAGLGLAIAKDICEKHGGTISARSPGRGRGSCFSIALPIVESERPPSGRVHTKMN